MASVKIASVAGIPIRLHFSLFLALPFLALVFSRLFQEAAAKAGGAQGHPLLWGLGLSVALFLAILVHELAHALVARKTGAFVKDITLLLIGGISRVPRLPPRPRDEALMALAGPLTSLALSGVFVLAESLLSSKAPFPVRFALLQLGQLNGLLGVFNLLPAFPMDGGRILRSLATPRLGRLRATQLAGKIGQGFAFLLAAAGLLAFNLVLLLIAFFVFMGAGAETREVELQERLQGRRVRDFMTPAPRVASPDSPAEALFQALKETRLEAIPVVSPEGALLGLVTWTVLLGVPLAQREGRRAHELLTRVPTVAPSDEVLTGMSQLKPPEIPLLPVVEAGHLVGTLSLPDISKSLSWQKTAP